MHPVFKYLLGLTTLVPFALTLWLMWSMMESFVLVANQGGSASPSTLAEWFDESLSLMLAALVISVLVLVVFLWHLYVRKAHLDLGKQALWTAGFLVFGSLAMLIYWGIYILPDETPRRAPARQRIAS